MAGCSLEVMEGDEMGKHSEHCDDIACLGCECDPECDDCDSGVSGDYYAGVTEGRRQEREQILKILLDEGFYESLAFLVSEFSDTGLLYEFSDKDAVVDKLLCEPHGWFLEEGEPCPVCEGIEIERERIVKVLSTCDEEVYGRLVYSGDRAELIALMGSEETE